MFSYSVVIRTLGNTGEKYLQMLKAIEQQTVKPEEIVVVIPEGYALDHSLGNERIIRSAKGMVSQRAVGIAEAKGEYLLVLDDDLDFPPDFAEQLYLHLVKEDLDCVLAFGDWGGRKWWGCNQGTLEDKSQELGQKSQGGIHRPGVLQQPQIGLFRHHHHHRRPPHLRQRGRQAVPGRCFCLLLYKSPRSEERSF